MSENKEVKSRFALVNKIKAILNLGDLGRIESFIERSIKFFTREIKQLESNNKAAELSYEGKLEEFNSKLEDAREDLESSYQCIDVDSIANNQAQDNYREIYFTRIESAELTIKTLEDVIKDLKTDRKAAIDDSKEAIQIRKDRIARISKKD